MQLEHLFQSSTLPEALLRLACQDATDGVRLAGTADQCQSLTVDWKSRGGMLRFEDFASQLNRAHVEVVRLTRQPPARDTRNPEIEPCRVSLRTNSMPLTIGGFPFIPTRGARDGLPTAYQGENRQKAEALRQVQRSGQLPLPLQEMPQACKLTPDSRTGCHEC